MTAESKVIANIVVLGDNPVVGIDFSLDGVQYDIHTINTTVALGSAEQWDLNAMTHMGGNQEGHPFHVHVNSFTVKQINNVAQPDDTTMDTLWVGHDQSATIWMRFKEWTGRPCTIATSSRTRTPG